MKQYKSTNHKDILNQFQTIYQKINTLIDQIYWDKKANNYNQHHPNRKLNKIKKTKRCTQFERFGPLFCIFLKYIIKKVTKKKKINNKPILNDFVFKKITTMY